MQNVLYSSSSDSGKQVNSVEVFQTHLSTSSEGQSHNSVEQNFMAELSDSEDDDVSEVESFMIEQDLDDDQLDTSKFLLSSEGGDSPDLQNVETDAHARLEALLEAAGLGKEGKPFTDPEILRKLTNSVSCALDEAAAALTRMRAENSNQGGQVDGSLAEACSDNDVGTVRRILDEGGSVHETSEEGESLLSLACSAGYYELAQVLLAMRANVEDRGVKGECTPLMEAASAGHVDIVRLLIAHGADVNAQSHTGNTPLMYACAGGHEEVVKELLESGANVEDHNENGHTPLMEAASAGHVRVAKLLLQHGAGINTHSNEFKESALTLACYKGHLEMVRFLLEAGADQEHKTDEMHTALMEASMDGHVEVARLLLDSGAQVNMPADSFESPLTLAACGGHVELAMLLLERGANIEEVNDEGYTPLMEAAREGHEEMVALLLSQGADINAQTEETQETALTLACCGGFLEVADFLVKAGAGIELGASTPLMEAAQEGHLELVRYLLDAGANVNATTGTGDTALTYACENGHTDVADLLLQIGANLEHESEGGRTPLMKAARAGHMCTVQFLISRGADVNRQTSTNDHTVLSLACAGGHSSVVELLLAHGADPSHKLKDNSTMLIEAAKGGHTSVVQMLLDYPNNLLQSPSDLAQLTPPNPDGAEAPRVPPHGLQVVNPQEPIQDPASICYTPNIHSGPSSHLSNGQHIPVDQHFVPTTSVATQCIDNRILSPSSSLSLPFIPPNPPPASPTITPPLYPSIDLDTQTDSNHDTALTLACAGGHDELVQLLLARGSDIEHRDKKGFTPLILAATAGHANVVEILLDHAADIEAQSERTKDTPLSLACSGGRYEVVEILLSRGANKEHRNVSDYTPLSLAASGGYVNIIKLLLSHGAEINSRTGSKLGISPLMLAAMNGHTTAVKLLLDMGSDINAQIETNRNTALTLACFQGRHEVVSLLVDRKANVEHRAKTGLTPLMEAASGGYTEVGRVLLDKGADVNASPVPSSRDTALTIAADKGHCEFVKLLIERGATVDVKNKKGNSPLWLAANGGHLDVVQLLVANGADIDSQDNRKVSCLMASFRKGHVKVVKWMVRHVTQFPSDQECTRYIATINDKELLKKCSQCMELIRAAKDRQAAEANKNATILLEELDMEKTREESKKAAAARRREKKRQKKKEKQMKENGIRDNKSDNNEGEDNEDEKEIFVCIEPPSATTTTTVGVSPVLNINDTNVNNVSTNITNRNIWNSNLQISKRPNLINNKNNIQHVKLTQGGANKVKENLKKVLHKEINDKEKRPDKKLSKEWENTKFYNSTSSTSEKGSTIATINSPSSNVFLTIAVTTTTNTSTTSKGSSKSGNSSSGKRKRDHHNRSLNLSGIGDLEGFDNVLPSKNKSQKNCIDSSRVSALDTFTEDILLDLLDLPNNNAQSNTSSGIKLRTSANNMKSPPSNITSPKRGGPNNGGHKREDGWKEVVRRSKKVLVPASAISRVIGRGGSNINTIREVSGAHIEVEKQKGTGDRTVTIKGSADATRQAHQLISALIKDVNQDLTELIPKNDLLKINSSTSALNLSHSPRSSKSSKNNNASQPIVCSSLQTSRITSLTESFPIVTQTWSSSIVNSTASPIKILPRSSVSASIINGTSGISSGRQLSPSENKINLQTTTNLPKSSVIYTSATQNPPQLKPANNTTTFASKIIENKIAPPNSPKKVSASSTNIISRSVMNSVPRTTSPQVSKLPSQLCVVGPSVPLPLKVNLQTNVQNPVCITNTLQNQQRKCFSAPPTGTRPEYSPFNNLFSEVAQQSVWGQKDKSKEENENRMNFASVAATGVSVLSTSVTGNIKPLEPTPPLPPPEPETDISAKAPGYRGNSHISPIGTNSQSSMTIQKCSPLQFNNTSAMSLPSNVPSSSVVSLQSSLNPNAPDFTSRSNFLPPSQAPIFNHSISLNENQSAFRPMYEPHPNLMKHVPQPSSQQNPLSFSSQQPNPAVSEFNTNIGMLVNNTGNFTPGNSSNVNIGGISNINPRRFSPLSIHPAPRSTNTTPSVGASSKEFVLISEWSKLQSFIHYVKCQNIYRNLTDEGSPVPTMSPVPSPRSSNTSSPVGVNCQEQTIKPIGEDRKLPRPIGTERAHRKAPVYNALSDTSGIWSYGSLQGTIPCFIRDKNLSNDWIHTPSKEEVMPNFIETTRPLENHIEPQFQPPIMPPVGSLYPQFANGIPPQIHLSHLYNNATMSHLVTSDWNNRIKLSTNDSLQDNKVLWNSWTHPPM